MKKIARERALGPAVAVWETDSCQVPALALALALAPPPGPNSFLFPTMTQLEKKTGMATLDLPIFRVS